MSLLPDALAARRTGSLERVETEALELERATSLAAAAAVRRPEIELPGALRWLERARRHVSAGLVAARVILPERFEHVPLTIEGFAAALGLSAESGWVLRTLRGIVPDALGSVPAPLGFDPGRGSARRRRSARQQGVGADLAPEHEEARTLTPTDSDPPHEP